MDSTLKHTKDLGCKRIILYLSNRMEWIVGLKIDDKFFIKNSYSTSNIRQKINEWFIRIIFNLKIK